MKRALCTVLVAGSTLLLSACLEVEQHPGWRHGAYDGKREPRPSAVHFHGDRLAWWAAISDRNQRQNEYNRTFHEGGLP